MFFEPHHHDLAARLVAAALAIAAAEAAADEPARDRAAVAAMADAGLFALVAPPDGAVDARALCLAREMLGHASPRADSIFAVQGLGTYALGAAGGAARAAELAAFARGERVAAFALTEPDAGSDVAALTTRATRDGDGWILDGDKHLISNLGLADHATVLATVDPAAGRKGITAFWVPLDAAGVTITRQDPIAPHPLGALALRGCRVGGDAVIGPVGGGFRLAMQTLDTYRVSVGAAAVGMARRALDEAARFVRARHQFGKSLADQPLVQAHLADMIVDLDAARLLVLRAAWARDRAAAGVRVTTEVSIAKLAATEAAQRVIDRAVQLFGGRGVLAGAVVEHLYRAIRPLRIYEGTSEIQRTIIGRAVAAAEAPTP
ncbi:MAG: acyl-CoA dehydrogenase [Kofleriaceae bacterium]|nr:acyl-CoA dehydrogenase [Kofleriaceae bacterium]